LKSEHGRNNRSMSDDPKRDVDELDEEQGELLEDREVMSVMRIVPEAALIEPDPKAYAASPEDPPPGT
jgi:hypothetical protein